MKASRLLLAATVVAPLILAGCGGSATSSKSYPTVVVPPAKHGPPITTPNGAVVWLPVPPRVYSTSPSAACEWVAYQSTSDKPPGNATLSPPAPGLKAVALAPRKIRVEYTFRTLPADCKPSYVSLGVVASQSTNATPNVREFAVHGLSGAQTLTYPSFLPAPDVALAAAEMPTGVRSRSVKVLIRR